MFFSTQAPARSAVSWAALTFLALSALPLQAQTRDLQTIDVVGTTPLGGVGVELSEFPANAQTLDDKDAREQGVTNLPGMEHKWIVEYRGRDAPDGPYVRFVRSWSGELLFVMPLNESRRSSGIFFVKRTWFVEHTEEEIIRLFDILLNVVVFKERFPYEFNNHDPVSMMWWSWIGIYVTNEHVTD